MPSTEQLISPIEAVIEETARRFGVTLEQLYSHNRTSQLIEARQVAAYVLWRRYPELSFPSLATLLNRRNHMAIKQAVHAVERRALLDDALASMLVELLRFPQRPELRR